MQLLQTPFFSLPAATRLATAARNLRLLTLAVLATCLLLSFSSALADGESSANGVAVPFNVNDVVSSAGSYSALTGSAMRAVPDLVVPGAVGKYPLAFLRTSTSRYVPGGDDDTPAPSINAGPFGPSGSWRHNYRWVFFKAGTSPAVWRVCYPEGRVVMFTRMNNLKEPSNSNLLATQDPYLRSMTPGVSDRLELVSGTTDYILHRDDGGTVYFQDQTTEYKAIWIRDPFNQQTNLTYFTSADSSSTSGWDASFIGKLKRVTEPAGRYISLSYVMFGGRPVVRYATASNGQQVQYDYDVETFNGTAFTKLVSASYLYDLDPNGYRYAAVYTYTADNTGGAQRPLLKTCNDPHFPGPLVRIKYQYDTSSTIYGQIQSEIDDATNATVSSFVQSSRTNNRGDGTSQNFNYPSGSYLLSSVSDFESPAKQTTFSFDINSYQTAVKDRNNKITSFVCDPYTGKHMSAAMTDPSNGQPLKVIYDYGSTSSVPYPVNPYWVMSVTDPRSHKTTFTRDGNHQATRVDYPNGTFETFNYNGFGQAYHHDKPDGSGYAYSFDGAGNLVAYTDSFNYPAGRNMYFYYDAINRLSQVTDFNGHNTWYTYNGRHQVTRVTHHDGTHVDSMYDRYGNCTSVTDELGHVTTTIYDSHRRPKTITTPVNAGGIATRTTNLSYERGMDSSGNAHNGRGFGLVTLPSGKKIKRLYTKNGYLRSETKGYGSATATTDTYNYDGSGNITSMIDTNSLTQATYVYDALGRKSTLTDANGHVTTWTYYPATNAYAGLPYQVTSPGATVGGTSVSTCTSYDAMDHLLATQDASGHSTGTSYDTYGRVSSVSDANGSYVYGYDTLARPASLTFPDGTTQVSTFDPVGNVLTYKNRANNTKTNLYDVRNRLTRYDWDDSSTSPVALAYDAASRVVDVENNYAGTIYTYNDAGQPLSEKLTNYLASSAVNTTGYGYDIDGNVNNFVYPAGDNFNYSYDDQNRCIGIPGFSGVSFQGEWVINRSLGNSTSTQYSYQANGRIYQLWHHHGGYDSTMSGYPSTNISLRYNGYEPNGQLAWSARANDGGTSGSGSSLENGSGENNNYGSDGSLSTFGFAYLNTAQSGDSHGDSSANPSNLTGANGVGGPGSYASSYPYDSSGNRSGSVKQFGSYTSYAADGENRYYGLYYDNKGCMTNAALGWTYAYNANDQMISATRISDGYNMQFAYDGAGRLVYQGSNAGLTIFCYAGSQRIEERNLSNNASIYRYFFDAPGSDSIVFRQKSSTGARLYYQYDALGNTTHVSDDNGLVLEQYLYDAYGIPYVYDKAGSYLGLTSLQDNRYLFHGSSAYEWLDLPQMYYCRARTYLPVQGRFLQPDPSGFEGGDINLYRYCGNDPVNDCDPSGLETDVAFYPALRYPILPGHTSIGTTSDKSLFVGDQMVALWQFGHPDEGTIPLVGALVGRDNDTPTRILKLDTTPTEEAAINKYIDETYYSPGLYDVVPVLPFQNNCATFVYNALKAAGIKVKYSVNPKVLFKNIQKALKGRLLNNPHSGYKFAGGGGDGSGSKSLGNLYGSEFFFTPSNDTGEVYVGQEARDHWITPLPPGASPVGGGSSGGGGATITDIDKSTDLEY